MSEPANKEVVVDASVIAALTLGERRADEAVRLLTGRRMLAPTLLPYEVADAVRHFVARAPATAPEASAALALCWRLPFRWVAPDAADILSAALETGLTCYDAAYLVVARYAGAPLATFDARLAAACRATAVRLADGL